MISWRGFAVSNAEACLCDPCVVTVVFSIGTAVQSPDSQQRHILGCTKCQTSHTCSYMGAVSITVLAWCATRQAAEDFPRSRPWPSISILELIVRCPDAL